MKYLETISAEWGLPLNSDQLAQFQIYRRLLVEWNSRLNLTRIIEPEAIEIRHFLDSLSCATVTGSLANLKAIDMGTGAGFPGLPLKILYPSLELTLVDSVAKKTRFLEVVASECGLNNVTILAARAEEMGQHKDHREAYDWAFARAVAQLRVLSEYLLPLVQVGGYVLAQKGESAEQESAEATNAIHLLGGGETSIRSIQLPNQTNAHYLITIPKQAPTAAKYPRRVGKPSKRPL